MQAGSVGMPPPLVRVALWLAHGRIYGKSSGVVRWGFSYVHRKEAKAVAYRQQRNYANLNKAMFDGEGQYDIPILAPAECDSVT